MRTREPACPTATESACGGGATSAAMVDHNDASRSRRASAAQQAFQHEPRLRVDANRRGAFEQRKRRRRLVEIELEPRGGDKALA